MSALKTVTAFACLLLASVARAGVEEGLAAMDRGDYPKALKEFQRMAERGDDKAMISVGVMYHQGQGAAW
jgi:uncharacterized protein